MKTQTLVISLLFCGIALSNAQTIVATSGNTYSNNSNTINFTLGEIIISTYSNANTEITQGFHQTSLKVIPVIDLNQGFTILVYPNPTSEFIYIESSRLVKDYHLEIYDTDGRLVIRKRMNELSTSINISQYPTAIYFLRILDANQNKVKVSKIIKTT